MSQFSMSCPQLFWQESLLSLTVIWFSQALLLLQMEVKFILQAESSKIAPLIIDHNPQLQFMMIVLNQDKHDARINRE